MNTKPIEMVTHTKVESIKNMPMGGKAATDFCWQLLEIANEWQIV